MRPNATSLVLAGLLIASAGCQETSTTSSTAVTSGATSSEGAAEKPAPAPAAPGLTTADKTMEVALPGGSAALRYTDLKIGDGSIAGVGSVVMVHYTGWLADGTKFDSSFDRDRPYPFRIGDIPPAVIEGWDKGIRGMRVGGKRKLVIPPELGYGSDGRLPVIPPNATLVFEVELVGSK